LIGFVPRDIVFQHALIFFIYTSAVK